MHVSWMLLLVLGVLFFATLIRSTFGFGEALIAVPLLSLLIPINVAVPLATLVSISVAAIVVLQDWRQIHLASAWRLVLATLLGIPLGLWLLTRVPEPVVKALLGAVIIGFSTFCLLNQHRYQLKHDRWAMGFGFVAGVLGGAYGMNGPPLVVYGSLRRWSPEQFRATLQGYFLPASILGMTGYWLSGLWTRPVTWYYLWSLPVVLTAIFWGRMLNRKLSGHLFLRCIHAGLLVVGAILLLQTFSRVAPEDSFGAAKPSEVALFASMSDTWGSLPTTSHPLCRPGGCKQPGPPMRSMQE